MLRPFFVRPKSALAAFALCVLAATAGAQTPTASPSSFVQGNESFLQISLSNLISTDTALVTFIEPGGTSTLEAQLVTDGFLVVWVPDSAMNNPGTYSVTMDVTHNGTTTAYGPLQISVVMSPDPSTLPPSLTLPEVLTAEATTAAGATVSLTGTASDGAPVTCVPASGSTFPLGSSNVNCSTNSASGSFQVFVYDTGRPVLTVPGDISTSRPVVTFATTATDAIDSSPTVACNPASGSNFPLGTTVVECTATDQFANSDSRPFRVTITNGSPVVIANLSVSEPYFSPNADGSKDLTTVSANAASVDTAWAINVTAPSGATVRSASGLGTALAFAWDGRDGSGVVQPDGTYGIFLTANDGIYSASAVSSTVIDRTAPTGTILAPSSGQTFSNVRQSGSTTSVTGTATDTNLLDWNLRAGITGETQSAFAGGTTAVNNAAFGSWPIADLVNGSYDLTLLVRDRAGNASSLTTTVTVAHFSVTQGAYELNTATGQPITYTSVVPFPVTQTMTVRNAAGVAVRTLVNEARAAGTYTDTWNGRDDGGAILPDGPYSYFATVAEGSNLLIWDLSNQMRSSTDTQLPYPSCSSKALPSGLCFSQSQSGFTYDLFANDPLKIQYSVAEASRVSVVFTSLSETLGNCTGVEVCVINGEYQASGSHVVSWPGVFSTGVFAATPPKLTVVRKTSTFPKNVVILYGSGSGAEVKNLALTPSVFSPESGPMTIEFDLTTNPNTNATVTMQMVRQAANGSPISTLQTITLPPQSPGHVTYVWDGKAVGGHWIAPGEYALLVEATGNGVSSQARSRFAAIY